MLEPGDLIVINEKVIGELRLMHENGHAIVKVAASDGWFFPRSQRVGIITAAHDSCRHCYSLSLIHYEIRNLQEDDFLIPDYL